MIERPRVRQRCSKRLKCSFGWSDLFLSVTQKLNLCVLREYYTPPRPPRQRLSPNSVIGKVPIIVERKVPECDERCANAQYP